MITDTKVCSMCGSELGSDEFYKKIGRYKDKIYTNLSNYCKSCCAEYRKKWRSTEHGSAVRKNWYNNYKLTVNGKMKLTEYSREGKKRYPQRTYARNRVSRFVKLGKIEKSEFCEVCNSDVNIQAHHYLGYDTEHIFDVKWLCSKCHRKADSEIT